MDVGTWLERLGLGQYERAFLDNNVDAEVLPELVAEDLADLGVASIGHRRKLLAAIAALRAEVSPLYPALTKQQPVSVREAERRQLTVMFADLVGSTELASQLDPEEMREVLRAYQDAVTGEVARYEGHVAKLIGDGVLAYFGWPSAHEDEAERAVRAGLSVVAAVGRLEAPGGGTLAVRVGIATGLVVVGDLVGHGAAEQEAVFGETPNLAARMLAVAEPASVVVAPGTHRLAGDLFAYADLGTRRLKGFPEPVRAWRVIGPGERVSRFEAREAAAVMPLLGREEELAFLLERWSRARSGQGQIVLLAGEPGIGKSRLLRALRDALDPEPHMALRHQCSPYHTHTALHPVIEQLERAAGFEREEAAEARLAKLQTLLARGEPDMTRTAALLADLLGIEAGSRHSPPQLTARQQKESTFAALLDQLVALAARSPLLVTLEDAHWIDPSTLELLDLAVDRVQDVPVLMVITYRPEFIPPWLGRPHVGSLTLRRLGRQLSAAMVGSVAGGRSLPTAVVEQIVAKTDGVPLFVEELTKAVLESGLLLGDDYRDPVVRLPLVLPIPDTLQDSLMARLDRLAPVKEVAQLAACIGREFDHALLAAVAPLGGKELATALDRLVEAELVFRHGAPPNATYTFKHALVQDAACQSLLKSRRQQHHGRIAAVLEERFPQMVESQPEVVARHCAEAGLIEKAADYRHKAAQVAMRRSAMAEAVAQVRDGLVLLSALPASPARTQKEIDLQLDLGHALTTLKGLAAPDTGAAYGRARELCRELGAAGPEPVALHGVWRFLHNRAELGAAQEAADELLRWGEARGDVATEVVGHRTAAATRFFRAELDAALKHYERVLALCEPSPHDAADNPLDPWLVTISHMSWELLLQGYPDRAFACRDEALAAAEAWAWPYMLAVVLHHQNVFDQMRGDPGALEPRSAALMALTAEHGFAHWHATATILHGWAVASRGELEAGLLEMRQGLAAKQATGAQLKVPYYQGLIAGLQIRAGRMAEASCLLEEALARVEATGERWFEAELHRLKGEASLLAGRSGRAEAEAQFRRAIEVSRKQGARWWELHGASSLAQLWAECGRRQQAYDLLAPIHGWFAEGFDTQSLRDAGALLEQLGVTGTCVIPR